MFTLFGLSALAAPLEEVADDAIALQALHGAPVVVALPDMQAKAAWTGVAPGGAQLIAVQAGSGSAAFDAVKGLECGVLVLREGPESYSSEPFGVCGGEVFGAVGAAGASDPGWIALGVTPSTLLLAPKVHLRGQGGFGMYGVTAGWSYSFPRATFQMTTAPHRGSSGLYVGGEAMIRRIDTISGDGATQQAANLIRIFDFLNFTGMGDEELSDAPVLITTEAFGFAPIVGAQWVGERGLFLSCQAGPQLLMIVGRDDFPFALRVSGQLLVGVVPEGRRQW